MSLLMAHSWSQSRDLLLAPGSLLSQRIMPNTKRTPSQPPKAKLTWEHKASQADAGLQLRTHPCLAFPQFCPPFSFPHSFSPESTSLAYRMDKYLPFQTVSGRPNWGQTSPGERNICAWVIEICVSFVWLWFFCARKSAFFLVMCYTGIGFQTSRCISIHSFTETFI